MGKFSGLKQELESQKTVETEAQNAVSTDLQKEQDKLVSLTIKVPEDLRQHWQIEAKRRRVSVTRLIVDYLSSELGVP
jgi:predicted HicB family RNase H-like nuclease